MFRSITNRLILALVFLVILLLLVAHFNRTAHFVPNGDSGQTSSEEFRRAVSTGLLPDPDLTPGIIDPNATKELICSQSTKLRRNVSAATKREVYRRYGMQDNHSLWCDTEERCEVDHRLPLEASGSNDIRNLWPQPYAGEYNAHMKDMLENKMHSMICNGTISLQDAQQVFLGNWIDGYNKYVK